MFRFPGSFVNRHHRHRIYSVHGFSTVLSPATIDFPSARFASLRGGVCPVEMEERRTCVGLRGPREGRIPRSPCGATYFLTLTVTSCAPDGHAGAGPLRPSAPAGTSSVGRLGLREPSGSGRSGAVRGRGGQTETPGVRSRGSLLAEPAGVAVSGRSCFRGRA